MYKRELAFKEQDYSSNFTSNAFLHFEMKETAKLLDAGLSIDRAKEKILDENFFNYRSRSGILKKITVLKRRFNAINKSFIRIIAHGSRQSSTLASLYSIYLTERLIREFMNEIVLNRIISLHSSLASCDMQLFLTEKAACSTRVSLWKDSTRKKLWSVTRKMFMECNILDKKGHLISQLPEPELKGLILKNCEYNFLKCIEGAMH